MYLCFESIETRNAWIGAVKAALDAEQTRLRLGYSISSSKEVVNGVSTTVNGNGDAGVGRKWSLPDRDSLRCALQRVRSE